MFLFSFLAKETISANSFLNVSTSEGSSSLLIIMPLNLTSTGFLSNEAASKNKSIGYYFPVSIEISWCEEWIICPELLTPSNTILYCVGKSAA